MAAAQQPAGDAQRQDLLQKLQEAEEAAAAVTAERDHAKQQLSRWTCFSGQNHPDAEMD